jgi:tryptophanyl-tRNA synthetase
VQHALLLPPYLKLSRIPVMSKEVILTGIRANNDLTIGNYFGAMLPMIDMATRRAEEYQVNLFIPDLHSFATPIDHSRLQEQIWHNLRLFVAAGLPLDKPDIHIYRQSYISAHSELTWILDCFTGFGEMSRMTQFKEKSLKIKDDNTEDFKEQYGDGELYDTKSKPPIMNTLLKLDRRISIGLFNYPVLMAADILLYGASYVPVGDDQSQHLEFSRDIGMRMNNQFGELFGIPKSVKEQHEFFGKDQGLRIKDLADPTKKMSKSDETGKGVIFLGDKPDAAAKKVMSAATDSMGSINFDWEKQPGITNLLQILSLLSGKAQDEVNAEWQGKSSYGELKSAVAEAVQDFLAGIQSKLAQVDDTAIQTKLEASETAMREVAIQNLLKVQKAVGLR